MRETRERKLAGRLYKELMAEPPERRLAAIAGDRRFVDLRVVGRLLAMADQWVRCRPAEAQGQVELALAILERLDTSGIYRQLDEGVGLGRCLLDKGWLLVEIDPREALAPLQRACELLGPGGSLWDVLRAQQALALCQTELDALAAAEETLRQSRKIQEQLSEPRDRLESAWTEARIEARLGRLDRSIDLLRHVIEGWLGRGEGFAAALAALDLAELFTGREDRSELGKLGKLLGEAGLPPEAALALRVGLDLSERSGELAAVLPIHLRSHLTRLRYDPGLTYSPARSESDALRWDALRAGRRRTICREVGVDVGLAQVAAERIPLETQRAVAWCYQELTGTRIEFAAYDRARPVLRRALQALGEQIGAVSRAVPGWGTLATISPGSRTVELGRLVAEAMDLQRGGDPEAALAKGVIVVQNMWTRVQAEEQARGRGPAG